MSKSLNKIQLIGRLGKDPDIRVTQGGAKVASFTIATDEKWKDKQGNWQEHTEWTKCTFFGPLADIVEKYVSKGKRVYVEGSIRTDKWTDKDGQDRYTTEIRGRDLILLDGGNGGQQGGPAPGMYSDPQQSGSPELQDDDIPF